MAAAAEVAAAVAAAEAVAEVAAAAEAVEAEVEAEEAEEAEAAVAAAAAVAAVAEAVAAAVAAAVAEAVAAAVAEAVAVAAAAAAAAAAAVAVAVAVAAVAVAAAAAAAAVAVVAPVVAEPVAPAEAVRLGRARVRASQASSPSCKPRQRPACFSPGRRLGGETPCLQSRRDTPWRAGEEASRTSGRVCRSAAIRTGSSRVIPTNGRASGRSSSPRPHARALSVRRRSAAASSCRGARLSYLRPAKRRRAGAGQRGRRGGGVWARKSLVLRTEGSAVGCGWLIPATGYPARATFCGRTASHDRQVAPWHWCRPTRSGRSLSRMAPSLWCARPARRTSHPTCCRVLDSGLKKQARPPYPQWRRRGEGASARATAEGMGEAWRR